MTSIIPTALSSGLRRLAFASVFASAVALGFSAVANAEWDIGWYDSCMKQPHNDPNYHEFCCRGSGGVWTGSKCVAPAANAQDPGSSPPTLLGPVPTQVMVPGNPPPANNAGG